MKYVKPNYRMLFALCLLVVAFCAVLFYFSISFIPKIYLFHWAILFGAVGLLFHPKSKQRFLITPPKTPRPSFWNWLGEVLLLELALICSACGVMMVVTYWLPFNENTSSPQLPGTVFSLFFKQYGLFPWAIYTLYAINLARTSYIEKKEGYFSRVFAPLFKTKPETNLGKVIDFQARAATITALATIGAFGILLIVCWVTPKSIALESGFHGKTILVATALLLLGSTRKFKRLLKPVLQPNRSALWVFIPVLLLLAFFVGLLNALFVALGHTFLKTPALIEWINRQGFTTLFLIFMISWWMCWTPLFSIHLARLAKFHSVRSTILVTLLLPSVLTVLFLCFPQASEIINHFPKTISLFSLAGIFYLLSKILDKSSLPLLVHNYLPKYNEPKYRNPYFYLRKLFQLTLIMLYLYLPAGLTLSSFFLFCVAFGFTLQVPFILFTF